MKVTRESGLVLSPSKSLKINFCEDADFVRIYGDEKPTDPACVKSCTVYTITVASCPALWQ